ncbi:uncharacterized protein LOC113500234 [Trichoplusia ni]|uniref:Uncharacterized protein LOC113500234 n=1 Tax=Trichoplusia ni TaxID=7111 RepID=A0A7E5W7Y7_TRINI|nr:uncharacterized protein LOC113500234 [Trichoplusia ni]
MQCGFNEEERKYKMFPSLCAMGAFSTCFKTKYVPTPLKFCVNNQLHPTRRLYGESCPVFCPNHYRPVCGASTLRSYIYKTFNNGCYFDMLNCRGDSDTSSYIEVPLEFCQRHLMKNIFKEQVVVSGLNDYRDYHEY